MLAMHANSFVERRIVLEEGTILSSPVESSKWYIGRAANLTTSYRPQVQNTIPGLSHLPPFLSLDAT